MEYENHYASKGVAGAGLGLGIAGTALGLMAGGLNGGTLFGNTCGCGQMSNDKLRIAELETEVKLRDANVYTLTEMGKFRDYVDRKFDAVNASICQQNVYNATNNATIGCIQAQVAQLAALTKVVVPIGSICPTPAVATTT